MKTYISSFASAVMILFFFSCEKNDALKTFADGSAPFLTASSSTVTPLPADADKVVLTLNWTDPGHAQDKSLYKYYLEIDSSGRNFSKSTIINITKNKESRTYGFIAKELNDIAISYGFEFNKSYDMDFRVVSSYGNNNEQKKSNTVKIKVTPYKVPPKVTLPPNNRLFIVGGATEGGWENPIPTNYEVAQELSRIDETTYGGIFQFSAESAYLLLPVNGSWEQKYAIPEEALNANSNVEGRFAFYDIGVSGGKDFPSPQQSGLYKLTVDFQRGLYKVEPFAQQHGLPSDLWVVGDAFTPAIPAWTNTSPMPDGSKFTRLNTTEWSINVTLNGTGKYLFLPFGNGNWSKYGAVNQDAPGVSSGGAFQPEGKDIPSAPAGNYKISVNLFNNSYKVQAN
jgi:hypothetical protein